MSPELGQRPIVANPGQNRISHLGGDEIKQSSPQENNDKTEGEVLLRFAKVTQGKIHSNFSSWSVETFELLSPQNWLKDELIRPPTM